MGMPRVERSGVSIRYDVSEGSGPPLLLLHGAMGTAETWRMEGYLDALADDFQVMSVDQRGHGESSRPHDPAAYTLAEFVADAVAVLDAVGVSSAYVCGFSLGAVVGIALAGRHPNRVAGLVTLGMSSCNLGFEDVRWEPPQEDLIELFEADGMAWVTAMLEAESRPAWARMLGAADPEVQIAILRADAFDGRVPGLRLCDLAVPMVCVWGEQEEALERALKLPLPSHARVQLIPGADHVGLVEHRDSVVPLLRRLALSSSPA
jgi:pimeloyl-ACP methyl ester carboxylesterase